MDRTTLANRPAQLAPLSRLEDFVEAGVYIRVSLKLAQGSVDTLVINAQAFEVDANGVNLVAPDGRPSRTPASQPTVLASSLGDTHTLQPGWVRKVGTYTVDDFTVTGQGKPTGEGAVDDEYFDTTSDIGYRWDEGESLRIARGKVDELLRIRANSQQLASLAF